MACHDRACDAIHGGLVVADGSCEISEQPDMKEGFRAKCMYGKKT